MNKHSFEADDLKRLMKIGSELKKLDVEIDGEVHQLIKELGTKIQQIEECEAKLSERCKKLKAATDSILTNIQPLNQKIDQFETRLTQVEEMVTMLTQNMVVDKGVAS